MTDPADDLAVGAAGGNGTYTLLIASQTSTLPVMAWSFDSNSPQRDTTVSVEDEVNALFGQPEPIPWRYKFVRLWHFLMRR